MAIIESNEMKEITRTADGSIQTATLTKVERDGVIIAQNLHYEVLAPGADLTGKPAEVVAICHAAWTPEVLAYHKEQARIQAEQAAAEEAAQKASQAQAEQEAADKLAAEQAAFQAAVDQAVAATIAAQNNTEPA